MWSKFNNNISLNISNEFKNAYLTTTSASWLYARCDEISTFETTTSMLNSIYQTITNASAFQASINHLTTFSPLEGTYLTALNAQNTLTSYLTLSWASSIYQTIGNMGDYITSGSLTTYVATGSLTAYQTIAGLNKSSVGLGNVDNTAASSLLINTATQSALDLKANIESPIFTGAPKLSIGGLNYDLITQPWVGGWFQFSSMAVQKQIGLRNFSVVRSSGYAAGSVDVSFPAHPAGGSYMIIFTPRLSSGAPVLYGYGGVINSTGFTVRFTNISGTLLDAEFSLFIQRN